jgi:large subunit ribosomal protein L13
VRTYSPKPGDITRAWHVIDATDIVLGRLAVQSANLLRGKHKPIFAPHVDTGDFVIIVNAEKIALSGDKLTNKLAYRHSPRTRARSSRTPSGACSPRTSWAGR